MVDLDSCVRIKAALQSEQKKTKAAVGEFELRCGSCGKSVFINRKSATPLEVADTVSEFMEDHEVCVGSIRRLPIQ